MTRRQWDEASVLAAIRGWVARYGEVPAATDFHPGDCMRSARISAARSAAWVARAQRSKEGEWPWPRTVQRLFGSWANAVRAAGFQPRREAMPALSPAAGPMLALERIQGLANKATRDETEARRILAEIADEALGALSV